MSYEFVECKTHNSYFKVDKRYKKKHIKESAILRLISEITKHLRIIIGLKHKKSAYFFQICGL